MTLQIVILLALMGGMMFLTARNQKKQHEQQKNMLDAIKEGDEVVTIGGLYGLVDSIDPEANKITLDIDGVYLTFERSAIKKTVKQQLSDEPAADRQLDDSSSAIDEND